MGDGRRRETAARHRGALGERIRWLVSGHATPHDGELTASEALARLHAVLDRLPIAVSAKDREGRFRFANAAMAASYGMSPEELVGTLQRDTHLAADQVEPPDFRGET